MFLLKIRLVSKIKEDNKISKIFIKVKILVTQFTDLP